MYSQTVSDYNDSIYACQSQQSEIEIKQQAAQNQIAEMHMNIRHVEREKEEIRHQIRLLKSKLSEKAVEAQHLEFNNEMC